MNNNIQTLLYLICILNRLFYTINSLHHNENTKIVYDNETDKDVLINTHTTKIIYYNKCLLHSLSNLLFKIISIAFDSIISNYEQIKNKKNIS